MGKKDITQRLTSRLLFLLNPKYLQALLYCMNYLNGNQIETATDKHYNICVDHNVIKGEILQKEESQLVVTR